MAQNTTPADRITNLHSELSTQTVTFEGHASTGVVLDSAAFGPLKAGGALEHPILSYCEYIAGAIAPTGTANITLINENGFDVLVGDGDNTAGVDTFFTVNKPIVGQLIFKLKNTSVNSATGTFVLYYTSVKIG